MYDFRNDNKNLYTISCPNSFHSGADTALVKDAIDVVRGEKEPSTTIVELVESHVISIAAEESRITQRVVDIVNYKLTFIHKNDLIKIYFHEGFILIL